MRLSPRILLFGGPRGFLVGPLPGVLLLGGGLRSCRLPVLPKPHPWGPQLSRDVLMNDPSMARCAPARNGSTCGGASTRFPALAAVSATSIRLLGHPSPAGELS